MDWFTDSIFYYVYVNGIYYLMSAIIYLFDLFYENKKIQQFDMNIYSKTMPTILMNTFVYMIPIYLMGGLYNQLDHKVFEWGAAIRDIILCVPLVDLFFYSFHRLFHLEYFYAYHKKHHEIHAPVGVTALYMHPVDVYFGNVIPIVLPAVIFKIHPYTFYFWIFSAIFNTVCFAHSGYQKISDFHDGHHALFNKNYGTDVFMDRLLGTFKK